MTVPIFCVNSPVSELAKVSNFFTASPNVVCKVVNVCTSLPKRAFIPFNVLIDVET